MFIARSLLFVHEAFAEKMERLTAQLGEQFEESGRLEGEIKQNLKSIGFEVGL